MAIFGFYLYRITQSSDDTIYSNAIDFFKLITQSSKGEAFPIYNTPLSSTFKNLEIAIIITISKKQQP